MVELTVESIIICCKGQNAARCPQNMPFPFPYFHSWIEWKNGDATFGFYAALIWNKLPKNCRAAETLVPLNQS